MVFNLTDTFVLTVSGYFTCFVIILRIIYATTCVTAALAVLSGFNGLLTKLVRIGTVNRVTNGIFSDHDDGRVY